MPPSENGRPTPGGGWENNAQFLVHFQWPIHWPQFEQLPTHSVIGAEIEDEETLIIDSSSNCFLAAVELVVNWPLDNAQSEENHFQIARVYFIRLNRTRSVAIEEYGAVNVLTSFIAIV